MSSATATAERVEPWAEEEKPEVRPDEEENKPHDTADDMSPQVDEGGKRRHASRAKDSKVRGDSTIRRVLRMARQAAAGSVGDDAHQQDSRHHRLHQQHRSSGGTPLHPVHRSTPAPFDSRAAVGQVDPVQHRQSPLPPPSKARQPLKVNPVASDDRGARSVLANAPNRHAYVELLRAEADAARQNLRRERGRTTRHVKAALDVAAVEQRARNELVQETLRDRTRIYRAFTERTLVLKTMESAAIPGDLGGQPGPSVFGSKSKRGKKPAMFAPPPNCDDLRRAVVSVYTKVPAIRTTTVSSLARAHYDHPLPKNAAVDVLPPMLSYEARLCTVHERQRRDEIIENEADERGCMTSNFHSVCRIYAELNSIGQVKPKDASSSSPPRRRRKSLLRYAGKPAVSTAERVAEANENSKQDDDADEEERSVASKPQNQESRTGPGTKKTVRIQESDNAEKKPSQPAREAKREDKPAQQDDEKRPAAVDDGHDEPAKTLTVSTDKAKADEATSASSNDNALPVAPADDDGEKKKPATPPPATKTDESPTDEAVKPNQSDDRVASDDASESMPPSSAASRHRDDDDHDDAKRDGTPQANVSLPPPASDDDDDGDEKKKESTPPPDRRPTPSPPPDADDSDAAADERKPTPNSG